MDTKILEHQLNSRFDKYSQYVQTKVPYVSYVSIIFFKKDEVICAPNNNFNDWGKKFYELKKYKDCILFEVGKIMYDSRNGTVMWEEVTHTGESLIIDQARKKAGIYNGITFILRLKDYCTLAINTCSTKNINKDDFYSGIISLKKSILSKVIEIFELKDSIIF